MNCHSGLWKPKAAALLLPAPCLPILLSLHSFLHHGAFKLGLGEEPYEPTLLKGEILHYCQGLKESLQENAKLVTTFFHSQLTGNSDVKKHLTASWRFCLSERTSDKRHSHWKGHLPLFMGIKDL